MTQLPSLIMSAFKSFLQHLGGASQGMAIFHLAYLREEEGVGPTSFVFWDQYPGCQVKMWVSGMAATLSGKGWFHHVCSASSITACLLSSPEINTPFPDRSPAIWSLPHHRFTLCPCLPLETQVGWPWMPSLTT